MKPAKIVLMGAGSLDFGPQMLYDLLALSDLSGNLALVDIDLERLAKVEKLAQRMNRTWGERFAITATNDRCEALPGADIVVSATEQKRFEMWRLDIEIPSRHGVKPTIAENGGPGGAFHTFRQVPVTLGTARDMERLCPNAWLLNMSNPESRICLAVSRYTRIKTVGICLGAYITRARMARVIGLTPEETDIKAAGVNHFHWVLDFRRAETGEDLYPLFRERVADVDPKWEPLSRQCLKLFGYYPGPADNHVAEYLSWGWQYLPANYTDRMYKPEELTRDRNAVVEEIISGEGPLPANLTRLYKDNQRWQTLDTIKSLLDNGNRYILSLNIPNEGCISNLSSHGIVEIPAMVGGDRIYGLHLGEMPPAIAALADLQLRIMDLVVDAAVSGDRQTALEALIIDPLMPDHQAASKILNELIEAEAEFLPQFC
jgi:alpha-galactosidase